MAGFLVAAFGAALFGAASFAAGWSGALADLLRRDAVPLGRAALGVLFLGTLAWIVGSFAYLKGAMDADEGDEGSGIA